MPPKQGLYSQTYCQYSIVQDPDQNQDFEVAKTRQPMCETETFQTYSRDALKPRHSPAKLNVMLMP